MKKRYRNEYQSQYRRTHRDRINSYSRQKMREYREAARHQLVYIEIAGRIVETTLHTYKSWYCSKFKILQGA